jgi:threonine dehydrogenase-like Zn-dependent dehydrogenase
MECLVATGPGTLTIVTREPDPLPAGGVRVRIAHVGICHSDTAAIATGEGPFPRRFGHEASGVVVESDAEELPVGSRVVAYVGDAYGSEVVCATDWVVPVDDACSLRDAALAEPLACVIGGLAMLGAEPAGPIAVVGAGFMGLLAVRLLAVDGHEVVVVEPQARNRALALELGAARALSPEQSTELGRGFDTVIEAVGAPAGLDTAGRLVSTAGTLGVMGYHQSAGGMRNVPMERWNFLGLRVLSLHHRNPDDILRWIRRAQRMSGLGVVRPAELVDEEVGLADLPATLTGEGGSVKTLLTM